MYRVKIRHESYFGHYDQAQITGITFTKEWQEFPGELLEIGTFQQPFLQVELIEEEPKPSKKGK